MRIFKVKKANMFSSIMLSFILVLLISLVSTTITCHIAYSELESEVNYSSMASVEQFGHAFDEKLSSVFASIDGICTNETLKTLTFSDAANEPLNKYSIYSLRKVMSSIGNRSIEDFIIYFKNNDEILSSLYSVFEPSVFEKTYYTGADSLCETLDSIPMSASMHVLPYQLSATKKSIAVFQPLTITSYKNNTTLLGVILDDAVIDELLSAYSMSSRGTVMILKKDGTVLMTSDDNFRFADGDFPREEGLYHYEYEGNSFNIVTVESAVSSDIIYSLSVPTDIYMEKLTGFKILVFVNIISFIILGFAAVILLSNYNYKPVKEMISSVSSVTKIDYDKTHTNEAKYIENVINETHNKNLEINQKLDKQSSSNMAIYLHRLLRGIQPYTSNIISDFKQHGIEIISDAFVVSMFSIDGWDKNIIDDIYEGQKVMIVETIVQNVFEEMINENYRGTVIYTDKDLFTCVINVAKPESASNENAIIDDICKLCRHAMKFIDEKMGIYCTVSISNICYGYAGLHEANNNATHALEYRLVRGDKRVISYASIEEKPFTVNESFYQDAKSELLSYIKTSMPSCFEVYNCIYENFMGKNVITPDAMMSFVNALNSVIADVYAHLGSSIDCNSIFVTVKHGDTPDKLSKQFCYIFFLFNTEYMKLHIDEHLSDKIRKYIDENHTDPGLGVNSIGYKFDMSPSYCSKIFKKEYGVSITDYILEARMQGARELLISSDQSVDKIAESLGFSSSSVFIRQFKKSCGMTPGSYRRTYGN